MGEPNLTVNAELGQKVWHYRLYIRRERSRRQYVDHAGRPATL